MTGDRGGSRGDARRAEASRWKQEVVGRALVHGGHAPLSFCQRRKKTGEPLVGWAGQLGQPGGLQVRGPGELSLFSVLLIVLFSIFLQLFWV